MAVTVLRNAVNESIRQILKFLAGNGASDSRDKSAEVHDGEDRGSAHSFCHDMGIHSDNLGNHYDWWPLLGRWF
jgi:hypothetical protein